MAQISGLPRFTPAPVETPAVDKSTAARLKPVAEAVRRLNAVQYAGEGREITFSVDRPSNKLVVKVIDSDTKEVVTQWPAEYALELAAAKG